MFGAPRETAEAAHGAGLACSTALKRGVNGICKSLTIMNVLSQQKRQPWIGWIGRRFFKLTSPLFNERLSAELIKLLLDNL